MSEKTAIITGGAKRVGKKIALSLAKKGFNIALHYNNSHEDAQNTRQQIIDLGVDCEIFCLDLRSLSEIDNFIEDVFSKLPNCNLLINNASIFYKKSFLDTDLEHLKKNFDINFFAPFLLTQSFAKKCYQNSQIINILDSYITKNDSPYFAYLLAKKTLKEFTKMAARQIAPIKVNAIAPGIIGNFFEDEEEGKFSKYKHQQLPLKDFPDIDDILTAINYLVDAKSVTACLLHSPFGAIR